MLRYWMCIIGPANKEELPSGASSPMRNAVENAFQKMLGRQNANCWSGWGLTQKRMKEVQEVWNKEETHQMQNDAHNQLLNNAACRAAPDEEAIMEGLNETEEHLQDALDEAATTKEQTPPSPSEQPEPTGPGPAPGPEPPEGAKVIRIWRTEDGKVYLNDADLGPGPTFDLLNWAQLTVKMPFFYREMVSELMRLTTYTMKQIAKAMHDHEDHYHHREVPDKSRDVSTGHPTDVRPKDDIKDGFKPEDNTTDVSRARGSRYTAAGHPTGVHPSDMSASPEAPVPDQRTGLPVRSNQAGCTD